MGAREVVRLQETVRRVPCADHVLRYAMKFARWTRGGETDAPSFVKDYVAWGAGPRASQNLVLAGKARAILRGRYCVSTEDVRAVAHPVLRHRIITNFNAEADGVTSDNVVDRLVQEIPVDEGDGIDALAARRVFAGPKGLDHEQDAAT
jgi:MoxR-like ATPase